MWNSCKTPEQGRQVQQDGNQEQDVGEKLEGKRANRQVKGSPLKSPNCKA